MKNVIVILAVLLVGGYLISGLFGHDARVSNLWSPASTGDAKTAMTYMTIDNKGSEQDTLVAIQTEAADHAFLKEETNKDGAKTVADLKTLDILGGQSKVLQPKGTYIFLTGLKKPLVKGDTFPITFVFDKRGLVEDQVLVEGSDATAYTTR